MSNSAVKAFNVALLCLLTISSLALAQPPENQINGEPSSSKPLVVLVSIDGFKPEYLRRGLSPTLNKLAEEGASSDGLIPPFPSLTFPSHYSVVTGLTPDHHGIVNNVMYDPQISDQVFKLSSREAVMNPKWWVDGIPIWVTASQQGKISSTLFWPGTEAKNQELQPQDWLTYDGKMDSMQRVEKLLEWLDRPDAKRADFATLYFSEVDSAGHEYGPRSKETNTSIHNVDLALTKFIEGLNRLKLKNKTTFVITSDHGMAEVSENNLVDIKSLVEKYDGTSIRWLGPLAGVDVDPKEKESVLSRLTKESHMDCWPKEKLPVEFHFGTNRRIPNIVCLAKLGWTITDNPNKKPIPGQHGYDPNLTDMHGIFIASGYRIEKRRLGKFNNIDVYPLLMKLIKLDGDSRDANDHLTKLIKE